MKSFSRYDLIAVIVPGAIVLAAIALLLPDTRALMTTKGVSLGSFGLFTLLAFCTGHLVQAVGNQVERFHWWRLDGMPTDRLRIEGRLASWPVGAAMRRRMVERGVELGFLESLDNEVSSKAWMSFISAVKAYVSNSGKGDRLSIFNGNYGLHRGIAAACLCLVVPLAVAGHWWLFAGSLVATWASLQRMNRFAEHYARELVAQFIQPVKPTPSSGEKDGTS